MCHCRYDVLFFVLLYNFFFFFFFFSSRRRHTRLQGDWSSDVCSSDLLVGDQTSPIRAGSFCVMSPAEGFHSLRNTGTKSLKFVMCFAGTGVQMERKA